MTLTETRSLETYRLKIQKKSKSAREQFENAYKKYTLFCNNPEQRITTLKSSPESASLDEIQNFYNFLTNHPRTNKIYTQQLAKFFRYMGIKVSNELIKEEVDFVKVPQEELHPLNIEEIRTILASCVYHKKALFLTQLSSGIRIGELVQLRKKHLTFIPEAQIFMIKIPTTIAKFQKARTTFVSIEATKALQMILRGKQDEDLIFATNEDPDTAKKAEIAYLNNIKDRVGLNKKYESNHTDLIGTHSFRAFFITQLSRHDPNLAKLLAGQKGYLLQYDRLSDQDKLELYKKFESDLLVFDDTKKDNKIMELQKVNSLYQEALKAKDEAIQQRDTILDLIKNGFVIKS